MIILTLKIRQKESGTYEGNIKNIFFYYAGCRYEDSGKYYYGSDGRRCYYTGWQMLERNWYYFNNYSEAVSGWKMINCEILF